MQFTGFRPKRKGSGSMGLPAVEALVIGASQTIKEGSALKIGGSERGYAADSASDLVGGYVVGFIVQYGNLNLPLRLVSDNSVYADGTYTYAVGGSSYAAAADNVTDKKISAVYVPAVDVICSGKLSADGATTTGSTTAGYYIDIETTAGNAATIIDEASASTTSANYLLVAGLSGVLATDPTVPTTADRRIMVLGNETEI